MERQVVQAESSRRCDPIRQLIVCVTIMLALYDVDSGRGVRAALQCYDCRGVSNDGSCGTPFTEQGIVTCQGTSCAVQRVWTSISNSTSGKKTGFTFPSCGSWIPTDDSRLVGGQQGDPTNLNACLTECFFSERCSAVDWNPDRPLGQNCVLHDRSQQSDLPVVDLGTTTFKLTRTSSCPPCGNQWMVVKEMQYDSGTPYNETIATLEGCMSACIQKVSCVGIDWNTGLSRADPGISPVPVCTITEATAYVGRFSVGDKDLTHYDLSRNRDCNGGYETIVRSCSRLSARRDVNCLPMRGVKNGIACWCSSELCNGDDDQMVTTEYSQMVGDALADSAQSAASWRGSARAYKASNLKRLRKPYADNRRLPRM